MARLLKRTFIKERLFKQGILLSFDVYSLISCNWGKKTTTSKRSETNLCRYCSIEFIWHQKIVKNKPSKSLVDLKNWKDDVFDLKKMSQKVLIKVHINRLNKAKYKKWGSAIYSLMGEAFPLDWIIYNDNLLVFLIYIYTFS